MVFEFGAERTFDIDIYDTCRRFSVSDIYLNDTTHDFFFSLLTLTVRPV